MCRERLVSVPSPSHCPSACRRLARIMQRRLLDGSLASAAWLAPAALFTTRLASANGVAAAFQASQHLYYAVGHTVEYVSSEFQLVMFVFRNICCISLVLAELSLNFS